MLASFAGVVVGGGTLVAAWLAARWAKKAADHTESGAIEAKRSADAAEKAVAADLRPYLFIDHVEVTREPNRVDIVLRFKNFGRIPARSAQVRWDCYIFPIDDDELRETVKKRAPVNLPVCAPGHERRVFAGVYMSEEDWNAFESSETNVVIRVRFSYYGSGLRRFTEHADYQVLRDSFKDGTAYLLTDDVLKKRKEWKKQRHLFISDPPEEDDGDFSEETTPE